jgi:hypothetical protein
MKRRSSRRPARIFNAPFPKSLAADRSANSFRALSGGRQPGAQTKRIYILKKAIHLRANSAESRIIQHILIFDEHPESLRLVFGFLQPTHFSASQRMISWEIVLASILTTGALIGMLWPLF